MPWLSPDSATVCAVDSPAKLAVNVSDAALVPYATWLVADSLVAHVMVPVLPEPPPETAVITGGVVSGMTKTAGPLPAAGNETALPAVSADVNR